VARDRPLPGEGKNEAGRDMNRAYDGRPFLSSRLRSQIALPLPYLGPVLLQVGTLFVTPTEGQ
jgi:hypothetical protein